MMRAALAFLIALAAVQQLSADWGGPDQFGYRWADSGEPGGPSYGWTEIRDLGTPLDLGDDESRAVALPRPFRYYGIDYDSFFVCSNGFLSFASAYASPYPEALPSTDPPNGIAAPLWNDLNPADPQSGGIYWHHDTAGGRLIVEWDSVVHFGSQRRYSFQAVLGLAERSLTFHYRLAAPGWQADAAQTGIEDHDGAVGLAVPAGNLCDEYAVRFEAPPDSYDVRAVRIAAPGWHVEPESLAAPELVVANGGRLEESFPVVCRITRNDTLVYADTALVVALPPGDSAMVGFRAWQAGPAGQRYRVMAYSDHKSDQDPANDTLVCATVSFPYRNKIVSVWRQGVIAIDGTLSPGEWPAAPSVDISDALGWFGEPAAPGNARLYAQNDSLALYLALDAPCDGALDAGDRWQLWIDDDGDGAWESGGSEGGYLLEYSGFDSLSFAGMPPQPPVPAAGIERASSLTGGRVQRELAIPLGGDAAWKLAQAPGGMLRALAWTEDGHDGSRFGWWPQPVDPSGEADPSCYGPVFLAPPPAGVASLRGGRQFPALPRLWQNAPNPFGQRTAIRYQLPVPGDVRLSVYNISGQAVRTLAAGRRPAGAYSAAWDGRNDAGQSSAPGVYFCRLAAGRANVVMRMTLVR